MPRRLLLLILVSALAVVLGFWSFTPKVALAIVRHGGYWFLLAAAAAFVVTLVRSLRGCSADLRPWREWVPPAIIALLAAAFLHVHEPHEVKIVADELVLGLTAKELHFAREATVTMRGYEYAGNFTTMGAYVDKRPLFFPFLLATVHDLTGYRPENVFALNALLSVVLMGLILLIGRRVGGWGAGLVAVLLVATIPLVAQNACGAGFELLNLVMVSLTIWLAMRAAERPEDSDRLGAFVLSAVLLAQVRYESVVFLLPAAGVVAYGWVRRRALLLPWSILVAPLLLVVAPLQLNVFKLSQTAWQLTDIAGADDVFGLRYFYDNVGHALNFLLSTDGSQANSLLVGVAGVFGVGFFVMLLYRRHREIFQKAPAEAALVIFLLGLLAHTGLMLCYFWGRWDDPVVRRLSLPAHLLFVLALIVVWPQIVKHRRRWTILGAAALLYVVAFTMPANAMHRFTQMGFAARTNAWLAEYARALGDRSALAIDRNGGLVWFLYDKSSIDISAVAARPEAFALHFRNHSFQEFYLVQRMAPVLPAGTRVVDADDTFGDAVQLQLVEERAFAPLYLVRLSRIVGVDEAKLKAWAKRRREPLRPAGPATTTASGLTPPNESEQLMIWLRELP